MAASTKVARRLVLAYVLDWVLIIVIAAIGGGLSFLAPTHRPFSLVDLRISYPYTPSSVSTSVLVVVSLIIPAISIAAISLLFLPHFTLSAASLRDRRFLSRKLWEWNAGWLGLALSYVSALLLTQMVKQVAGRPRPDFLSRCGPNVSDVSSHYAGGDGQAVADTWVLVDWTICSAPYGQSELDDGWRSFFSGHSSSSFAGLLYLSLWLAVKCNITLPHWYGPNSDHRAAGNEGHNARDHHPIDDESSTDDAPSADDELRTAGAAAPVWGFIVFFVPIVVALYIALTRYREFKHDGIDVSVGILVGCFTAYMGFRSYHASLRRGKTWTFAPRTVGEAFFLGGGGRSRVGGGRGGDVRGEKRDDERVTTGANGLHNGVENGGVARPRAYEEV